MLSVVRQGGRMIGLRSKLRGLRQRVSRKVDAMTRDPRVEEIVAEPVSFQRVDDSPLPPDAEPIEGHWPKEPGSIECEWPEEFGSREKLIVRRIVRYASLRVTNQDQCSALAAGYDDGCRGDYRVWTPAPASGGGWLPPLLLANERWSRHVYVGLWEQGFYMARADGRVPGWMGEADWSWWQAGLRKRTTHSEESEDA